MKYLDYIKKVIKEAIKRKYLVIIVIFAIWLLIFDKNSMLNHIKNNNKYHKLQVEKEYYLDKITEDSTKLEELKTNDDNLEKYAREQYLMHKKNEEIFIIVEKE